MQVAISFLIGNKETGYQSKWALIELNQNTQLYPTPDNPSSIVNYLLPKDSPEGTDIVVLNVTPNVLVSEKVFALPEEVVDKLKRLETLESDDYQTPASPLGV